MYWDGIAPTVIAPVQYVPEETAVCEEVVGVTVLAACVVTDAVRLTEEFPAVPELTYPADTDGVTDTVLLKVRVFVPVDTEALVPVILAGAVAEPLDTDLLACAE